jgi:CBS-domain-containing membrane protein
LHASLGAGLAVALVGAIALWVRAPLLFPAIGASAFLACAHPSAPFSAPRNALFGHAIGLAAGSLGAAMLGVTRVHPWLSQTDPWRAVVSCALALACSTWGMQRLRAGHPPAGATTLIFGCGLMGGWRDAFAVLAAVIVLITFSRFLHRSSGAEFPLWDPKLPRSGSAPAP